MRVLVTGSDGYIGSVLVQVLQDAGHDVVGLDTCFMSNRKFLREPPDYELVKGDIRDVEASSMMGFDAICHLAALSNDPAGELNASITDEINYGGSLHLAQLAKSTGVKRFLYSSSCSIYGAGDVSDHLSEEAQFNPVSAYALSKVKAEADLSKLADDHFSPVFLRNATAYGVSPKLRLDLVVNNLVAWAITTGKIAMSSDGTPWRPLVHVRDICMAFRCALETPRELVHNQAFNIGRTDSNFQIRDIAEQIGGVINQAEITFAKKEREEKDTRTYKVSFEKALTKLQGFQPAWTLKAGIEELLDSYQDFDLKYEHLHGDEFITLNRYKSLLEQALIDDEFRWIEREN
jgi:nucleoside-diphosphate-sugar epimerase